MSSHRYDGTSQVCPSAAVSQWGPILICTLNKVVEYKSPMEPVPGEFVLGTQNMVVIKIGINIPNKNRSYNKDNRGGRGTKVVPR